LYRPVTTHYRAIAVTDHRRAGSSFPLSADYYYFP